MVNKSSKSNLCYIDSDRIVIRRLPARPWGGGGFCLPQYSFTRWHTAFAVCFFCCPGGSGRQIGVCWDATVGAAISRPLLFRQRKCFRLSETLRNLNVFGRLIAAPTVAMQRVWKSTNTNLPICWVKPISILCFIPKGFHNCQLLIVNCQL